MNVSDLNGSDGEMYFNKSNIIILAMDLNSMELVQFNWMCMCFYTHIIIIIWVLCWSLRSKNDIAILYNILQLNRQTMDMLLFLCIQNSETRNWKFVHFSRKKYLWIFYNTIRVFNMKFILWILNGEMKKMQTESEWFEL